MPFSLFERFIAYRYLKPLRSGGLLSIISWYSFIGICIGVATLIIVMSVMNGFRYELENRIIGFNGHIYIQKIEKYFKYDFQSLEELHEIKFIDPNITIQSLISTDHATKGILVKSIIPKNIKHYSFIDENVIADNEFNDSGIILGATLLENIGAEIGSSIKLFSSNTISSPFGQLPKSISFEVKGVFNSGMSEYNSSFAFPIILKPKFKHLREAIFKVLKKNRIEFRLIAGGCFTKHPSKKFYNFEIFKNNLKNAELIHHNGFWIGNFDSMR